MMKRWLVVAAVALVALALDATAGRAGPFRSRSGGSCGGGVSCNAGCSAAPACNTSYTWETRTVMAPQMVTETQTVTVWENRYETRPQKVTRYRTVPVTQQVPYTYTVWQPETRTRTETYSVCVPVTRAQTQTYTVLVPQAEKRTATRQVPRWVQETVNQQVTRDTGHYEERQVQQACASAYAPCGGWQNCGGCGGCAEACAPQTVTVTHQVWVPNYVTTTEKVTVNRLQYTNEQFEYTVTVCRPETRQQTVNVTSYEQQAQSREVSYTVMVPKTQNATQTVTSYKTETYEETVNYTVCVPHQVQKQVQVQVCRMVPTTVQVCVPVTTCAAPAGIAAPCDY